MEEEDAEDYLEEVWGERWDRTNKDLKDFKDPCLSVSGYSSNYSEYESVWDGWGDDFSSSSRSNTPTRGGAPSHRNNYQGMTDVEIFQRAANKLRPSGNKHLTSTQKKVNDPPFDLSDELDRPSINTRTVSASQITPSFNNGTKPLMTRAEALESIRIVTKKIDPNAATGRQITPSEAVKAELRVKAGDPSQDPDFTNKPLNEVIVCKGRDNPEALEDDDDLGDNDPEYIREMNRFLSPPPSTKDEDGISILQRTAMPPKDVDNSWETEFLEGEDILSFPEGSAVATFQDGTPLPPVSEMWKIDILSLQEETLPEAIRYGAYDHYFDDKKYDEWNSMFPNRLENEMNRPNRSRDQEVIDRYRALYVPPIVEPRGRANEKAAYNIIKLEFNQQRLAIAGSHLDSEDVEDYMTDELFSVYEQIDPPPLEADPWNKYYCQDDYTVFQMLNLEWSERYNLILNLIDNLRGYDYGNEE